MIKRVTSLFDVISDNASEAADMKFRADLMITLRDLFEDRGWKQADIAKALELPQPRVSDLMRGKIDRFSADKLIGFLAKLDVRLKPSFADHKVTCEVQVAA
ncbi:XRE family transcriptional regulator (plasmid) [Rhizobium sp. CB3090]|uniref:helix-turn-helix domain-containing protein n=1 Tax=Rhizobium sp. CB3090 TaxID=3039156 RepID=UPI0024B13D13|nr:XRE family transcriptional regulator [Rhizobium sp. CB3090]WFU13039.1 XRE family transcriptional regulator [Rhizobium sp. CB3090]